MIATTTLRLFLKYIDKMNVAKRSYIIKLLVKLRDKQMDFSAHIRIKVLDRKIQEIINF